MEIVPVHLDMDSYIVRIESSRFQLGPVSDADPFFDKGLQYFIVPVQHSPYPELEISQALGLFVVIPVLAGIATELPVNPAPVESLSALQTEPFFILLVQ